MQRRSLLARIGIAVLGLAVGVTFAALTIGLARLPMPSKPAWVEWFALGSVVGFLGGISAGGFWAAWVLARGERRLVVPEAARARCPACGEPWSGEGCARCGQARAGCAEAWSEVSPTDPAPFLVATSMAVGVLCFGLFLGSYGVFGQRSGALVTLVFAALALLHVWAGGKMVRTCATALGEAVQADRVRVHQLVLAPDARSVSVTAFARIERGVLHLRGEAERSMAVEAWPAEEHAAAPLPAACRAVVRVLGVLHARGEITLRFHERTTWTLSLGAGPGEVERTTLADVQIKAAPHVLAPRRTDGAALPRPLVDARDLVLERLGNIHASALAEAVAQPSALANAFETYAAHLSSAEADERVLAALASVIRLAPQRPAAPYRGVA